MAYNKVILVGNMVSDPELKVTTSGQNVTRFHIAVQRRFTKQGEGDITDFFTIVAWGKLSAFVCRFFKKGMPILVSGSIQNNNWTDNQGTKHFAVEVVAEEITHVERKRKDTQDAPGDMNGFEDLANDEELPF